MSEFAVFIAEVHRQLDSLIAGQKELNELQRVQNGKVAELAQIVAVHEDRLDRVRDSRGRWIAAVSSAAVATFAWILHLWR